MDDLAFVPAQQLATLIRERHVSAVHVLDTFLTRIARHNAPLHAIVTLDEAGARQRAAAADAALAHNQVWGPLHGVPITLEDCHATAGIRSTWGGGAPPWWDHVPAEDSAVPARLKAAGAVLLGKTNGPLIWPDSRFPLPTNPYHPERQTGGSAGGPAAAVAAGLTAFDVGLDTLGSILQPAAYCGVVGMRPTEHRIPLSGSFFIDSVRKARVMTVAGPITRSVQDLRFALHLLIGPDGRDTQVAPVPWRESPAPDLRQLRLAWTPAFPGMLIAHAVRTAIEQFAQQVAARGVQIEAQLPAIDFAEQARLGAHLVGLLAGTFQAPTEDAPPASLEAYLLALHHRDHYMALWDAFLSQWDALIGPVTSITADSLTDTVKRVDGRVITAAERPAFFMATSIAAVPGCPTVVIPIASDQDGLPIAVQIIGQRWSDERLIAIADVLFEVAGGFKPPPVS